MQTKAKIVSLTIVILLWILATTQYAFIWTLFIIWATYKFDERILGWTALLFFMCIPVFLFQNNQMKAERMATYTYFLLIMIVALQFLDQFNQAKGRRALKKKLYKMPNNEISPEPIPRPKVDHIVKEH
jgi:hypothetical protein